MSRTLPAQQPDFFADHHSDLETAGTSYESDSTDAPWMNYFDPAVQVVEGSDQQFALATQDHHAFPLAGEAGGVPAVEATSTTGTLTSSSRDNLANEYAHYDISNSAVTLDTAQPEPVLPPALPFDQPPTQLDELNSAQPLGPFQYPGIPLPPNEFFDEQALYESYQLLGVEGWQSFYFGAEQAGGSSMPSSNLWVAGMNVPDLSLNPLGHDVQSDNTYVSPGQSHATVEDGLVATHSHSLGADFAASGSTSVRSGKKRAYSESSAAETSASGYARSVRSAPFADSEHGESAASVDEDSSPAEPADPLAKFKSPPVATTARGQILAESGYTQEPGQTWACLFPECAKSFTDWDAFYLHHTRCRKGPDVLVPCQFCGNAVASGCRPFEMKRHLTGRGGFPVCTEFPGLGLANVGELMDWLELRGKMMEPKHLSSDLSRDLERLAKGEIERGKRLSVRVVVAEPKAKAKKTRPRVAKKAKAEAQTAAGSREAHEAGPSGTKAGADSSASNTGDLP